ncbi:hypothetical protein HDU76_006365 [Blyttiomyces sp. JEL0837]|nr:hypothetical protein HDU76_006365 [Blyttiomyces sp. JEL0837]
MAPLISVVTPVEYTRAKTGVARQQQQPSALASETLAACSVTYLPSGQSTTFWFTGGSQTGWSDSTGSPASPAAMPSRLSQDNTQAPHWTLDKLANRADSTSTGVCSPALALPFIEEMRNAVQGQNVSAVLCIATPRTSNSRGSSGASDTVIWPGFICGNSVFIRIPESIGLTGGNSFGFKESVIAALELAEDAFGCDSLVFCLDKTRKDIASLLRSFLFIGFEIVHPSVYNVGEKFILVGQSFGSVDSI